MTAPAFPSFSPGTPQPQNIDWESVGLFVLYELRRLNEGLTQTATAVGALKLDMAVSKARSSWWGAIAGTVAGALFSGLVALLVKVFGS